MMYLPRSEVTTTIIVPAGATPFSFLFVALPQNLRVD
jgi:hypothetical protein